MAGRERRRVGKLCGALGALCAALFLSLPSPAAAQTITFTSASAIWHSPQDNVPGVQPGDPVITNGIPTSSVSWGTTSGPQSGYDVTITIPDPTMFPVADFSHRNFPVSDPSLTSIQLDIVLDFLVDGALAGPLTFTFTFTHEETPNNLDPCPYPTPPGEGCTDRVTFLEAPDPTTFTVGGKTYTLGMNFLDDSGNPVEEFITSEGGVVNTAELDVEFELVPPVLEVTKSGPATLALGAPGVFTLDVENTGPNDAWNATLLDVLPDAAAGGMCVSPPQVLSAEVFTAGGVGKGPLQAGIDFSVSWAAATCELTLTMSSAAGVLAAGERLQVSYQALLDGDSPGGSAFTNVAGATEWFDDDPANPGRGIYERTLSDGTVGATDHEDAHTLTTDLPDYLFEKTAVDPVSGTPLSTASPGDTIRYRLRLENRTTGPLVGLGFTDEIDRLNGSPLFEPGSLGVMAPAGSDPSGTDPAGGAAGTGVLDVRDLSVAAGDSVIVEYDVTLVGVIPDGTLAIDQAELLIGGVPFGESDDPGVNGSADPFVADDEDPTVVQIDSAPDLVVEKVSAYVSGDPSVLLAGETLRYTITVANVGSADAFDVSLRDDVPVNTSYVPGSTTLNGASVPDAGSGASPLVAGIQVHAPAEPTPGTLRADPAGSQVATIVFDVVVDGGVPDGTIVSNQAFASSPAAGISAQPSDDPRTALPDDPTRDVVGSSPLLFAPKTAALAVDLGSPGIVDPNDVLHYTITVYNTGAVPATGMFLTDSVPANTTYVADSTTLNGTSIGSDGGVSPLIAGLPISSSDLTPPLPGPGGGTLSAGASAVIEFDLRVNPGVPADTIISNQAVVTTAELPPLLTDGDGNPATGPEPTQVVVGSGQQLSITKQVAVVGGGAALAGTQLEYVVSVVNIGAVPAFDVVVSDDLDDPFAGQLAYVIGSATMNGSPLGVGFSGSTLTASYSATYGPLQPGQGVVLRFRAEIDPGLALGTTVTNVGQVTWNVPPRNASASVSVDVGGTPGAGTLSGTVWHDADFDGSVGGGERLLASWSVALYQGGTLLQTVLTDASGAFRISGVAANDPGGVPYELRFEAPGAGPSTASLGFADSVFTNGPQRISDIRVASGADLRELDLPIQPNGVVYDAIQRTPIAGATLTLLDGTGNVPVPPACLADPVQQGQVTGGDGYYKFDLVFAPACSSPDDYRISVAPPASGYVAGVSTIIPPDAASPFDVPGCPGDAVPATGAHCESQPSELAPAPSVPPRTAGTVYRLHLTFDDTDIPGSSQIYNNHVPLDPDLDGAVAISKRTPSIHVVRGQLVPYEIVVSNELGSGLLDLSIVDTFPSGFQYVEGSARIDGVPIEPSVSGRQLIWTDVGVEAASRRTVVLLLAVGGGVGEGEFVNRARAFSSVTGEPLSGEARATVRVAPDATFDCTDVIGKVYADSNRNGVQDDGEEGLGGVRVVTARGLAVRTDPYGRFHITCAITPYAGRGSNFMLKLDDHTLPTGYRMSTRQTQVQRATRGKALRFSFGASIHHVVGLDLAGEVFEPGSTEMRPQWRPRLHVLLDQLDKAPAILRLSYVADIEDPDLVEERLEAVREQIMQAWQEREDRYSLTIEPEVFWLRGKPPELPVIREAP